MNLTAVVAILFPATAVLLLLLVPAAFEGAAVAFTPASTTPTIVMLSAKAPVAARAAKAMRVFFI
jgi:hypothetical protein